MWFVLAILSAFSESAKDTFGKLSVLKTDEYTSALVLHIVSLLISFILVIHNGIPTITSLFWLGTLAFIFITPAWTLLYMRALKLSPLSITLPMMALNPIFTALLAYLFNGATPDTLGWIGIILISIGIYFVNTKNMEIKAIHKNILAIFSEKGALAMLGVAFLWSLGAHFSKMRVDGSTPIFSTFTGSLIGVLTTYFLAYYNHKSIYYSTIVKHFRSLLSMSFFYYLATLTSSYALALSSAAYVFSVKRSSILFSSLSGKIFFHEEFYNWKYIGITLIATGILALSL